MKINRIGEVWINYQGYDMTVIAYRGYGDCDVKTKDNTIIKNVQYGHLKRGQVKNPYHPSVFGVGYIGIGKHQTSINGVRTKMYTVWGSMMQRGYDIKYHEKRPTYKDCSVLEEWYNFQNFGDWFEENYVENYVLDKDILIKGNKIYSSKNCCFVPQEINMLFTKSDKVRGEYPIGVRYNHVGFQARCNIQGKFESLGTFKTPELAFQAYKKAKEHEIKEVAKLCKNIISDKVYAALYAYKVEIND